MVDEICFFNARISTQQPKSAFDKNYLIETSDNIMLKEVNLLRIHLLDQKSNSTAVLWGDRQNHRHEESVQACYSLAPSLTCSDIFDEANVYFHS